ncbi:MAG: hypothetical protein ACK5HU_00045 [Flavobacteriales bacterium]
MNYFIIKEHIKFWWTAHTAHGIHSPFIYNLITQCLHKPNLTYPIQFHTESISKKYCKLLNRVLNFYSLKSISTNHLHHFDAIITQNFQNSEEIIPKLKNNQFWFILNIRQNPKTLKKWLDLTQRTDIKVTIDLFTIGIVLQRTEQVKENFQLKVKF